MIPQHYIAENIFPSEQRSRVISWRALILHHTEKIHASQLFSPLATFLAHQPPCLWGTSPKCQSKSQMNVKNVQTDDFLQLSSGTVSGGDRVHFQPFYFSGASFFFYGRAIFHKWRTSGLFVEGEAFKCCTLWPPVSFLHSEICSLRLRSSPSFSWSKSLLALTDIINANSKYSCVTRLSNV